MMDIHDYAMKYVNRHPHDKSDQILSVMRGRWGKRAAEEAVRKAEDVRAMLDPQYAEELTRKRLEQQRRSQSPDFGRLLSKKASLVVLDDPWF